MFSKTNKIKRNFIMVIALALVILLVSALTFTIQANMIKFPIPHNSVGTYWTNYTSRPSGDGGESSPYTIKSEAWLIDNMKTGDIYISMDTDIDLSAHQWVPIKCRSISIDNGYIGVHFEGNGHTISNMRVNNSGFNGGLFDTFDAKYRSALTVSNLDFENVDISQSGDAGTLAGYILGGTIDNVYVKSGVIKGESVGGLYAMGWSEVWNSSNNATVISSGSCAGGIVAYGDYHNGNINTGDIYAGADYLPGVESTQGHIGGIAGYSDYIANCFNYGDIHVLRGTPIVGGVVGRGRVSSSGSMCNIIVVSSACYIGSISGTYTSAHTEKSFGIANVYLDNPDAAVSAVNPWGSEDGDMQNCYSYTRVYKTGDSALVEHRRLAANKDEFNELYAHDANINGGFPFLKSMYAVGQFMDTNPYDYLKNNGFLS